jgi:hypothetical protein
MKTTNNQSIPRSAFLANCQQKKGATNGEVGGDASDLQL